MAVWVIRAESDGANENFALAHGCAVIGYTSGAFPIPALSGFDSLEKLSEVVCESYGAYGVSAGRAKARQMWKFANEVRKDDRVVLPLKMRSGKRVYPIMENGEIAIGKIVGDYEYVADGEERTKHRRRVKWLCRVPRRDLSKGTNMALNRPLTVYSLDDGAAEEIRRKLGRLKCPPV